MSVHSTIVQQFGNPRGLLGRLVGFVMMMRPSNRLRSMLTIQLLDIQPEDHVFEIGFGPGLAIERAAGLASRGKVVGLDRSELMLAQASRRNAAAIQAGRVELHPGGAEQLSRFEKQFDKVFAVNVFMFWDDPVAVLRSLSATMKPGATIAITLQPRSRGATSAEARAGGERIAEALRAAGFTDVRTEMLSMRPVDAACVLGRSRAT
jgi:SAM-dependent methyltransferase